MRQATMSGVDDGEDKASQTGMMPIEWASVLQVIGSRFSPACLGSAHFVW